jgi:hypothetical protein
MFIAVTMSNPRLQTKIGWGFGPVCLHCTSHSHQFELVVLQPRTSTSSCRLHQLVYLILVRFIRFKDVLGTLTILSNMYPTNSSMGALASMHTFKSVCNQRSSQNYSIVYCWVNLITIINFFIQKLEVSVSKKV